MLVTSSRLGQRTEFPRANSPSSESTPSMSSDQRESPRRYSLQELQEASHEPLAVSDVFRTIEATSNSIHSQSYSGSLLMPEISEDRVHDFDDEPDKPENDSQDEPSSTYRPRLERTSGTSLAHLTSQLVAAQRSPIRRQPSVKKQAVTAGEKMAETAQLLFASKPSKSSVMAGPTAQDMEMGGAQPELVTSPTTEEAAKRFAFKKYHVARKNMIDNKDFFVDFMKPKKKTIHRYFMLRCKFFIIPSTLIAAFCFYAIDNPPHGRASDPDVEASSEIKVSVSWWFLFLGVRQVITQSCAWLIEVLLIDFLCLKTRIFTDLLGSYVSLWIAQAKGWPFRAIVWGLLNIMFLAGSAKYANHWLFWQDWIDMCNANNPSGGVPDSEFYKRFLGCMIGFGLATGAKRSILANFMGKRLVCKYENVDIFSTLNRDSY
jgi:hypothetical protein